MRTQDLELDEELEVVDLASERAAWEAAAAAVESMDISMRRKGDIEAAGL